MSKMERFEDVLTELAKVRTTGYSGDHYAYMSGYLFSLVRELTAGDERGQLIIDNLTRSNEQILFQINKMAEVDSLV